MKNNIHQEIIVSSVLILLLILLADPFGWSQYFMMSFITICSVIVAFIFFAGLVWRERAKDEREDFHRMMAGRFAYLAGAAVLITGTIYQKMNSQLDKWLIVALSVMVFGKLIGLVYSKIRH